MSFHDELMALADKLSASGESPSPPCPDPVNAAMIRNWAQALGDTHDWGETAPPAMIQVWTITKSAMRMSSCSRVCDRRNARQAIE